MSPDPARSFPHLFSPLPLGRRQARNRVFRAATATNLAEKFDVSDRLLAHYAALARGGAGVIVTESMRIHPPWRGAATFLASIRRSFPD